MRRTLRVALALALVALAALVPAGPASAVDGEGVFVTPYSPIATSTALDGNLVVIKTVDGTLIAGPVGVSVVPVESATGGLQLGVLMPDPAVAPTPGWDTGRVSALLDAVALGTEPVDAERALPVQQASGAEDPAGSISCIKKHAPDGALFAKQCVERRKGPDDGTWRFVIDEAYTYAEVQRDARENFWMTSITNQTAYNKGSQEVVDWTPRGIVARSDCTNYPISLSVGPVTAGLSLPVCASQHEPRHNDTIDAVKSAWYGKQRTNPSNAEHIAAVKLASGRMSEVLFTHTVDYSWRCWAFTQCRHVNQ